MIDANQRAWLDSLDPSVRTTAEADIRYYDDPSRWDLEEFEFVDDWQPTGDMSFAVSFTRDELELIRDGFGVGSNPIQNMHDLLIKRAEQLIAERPAAESRTVAAAD